MIEVGQVYKCKREWVPSVVVNAITEEFVYLINQKGNSYRLTKKFFLKYYEEVAK